MPDWKFNLGQFVCWRSKDGRPEGNGIVKEAVRKPDGTTFYLVSGVWVQEELLLDGEPLLEWLKQPLDPIGRALMPWVTAVGDAAMGKPAREEADEPVVVQVRQN